MKMIFEILVLSSLMFQVLGSDHIDGPVTMNHGVADISDLYAFPNENNSQKLILILNASPLVASDGHFSEKVNYVFILRKVKIDNLNKKMKTFDEQTIECSFKTPHGSDYSVMCKSSSGLKVESKIGKVNESGDFKLFAGMVSDPFFLNKEWVTSSVEEGFLVQPDNENLMAKLNVLSIVIEVDINKIFPSYSNNLIAVAAKSMTRDSIHSNWRQLDWVGRPELTNFSTIPNGHIQELRDLYNKETPFQRPLQNENLYRVRIEKNILTHFDPQDSRKDWSKQKAKKYVDILLDDFLVLAPHLSCNGDHYFSIESNILKGEVIQNCGGRKLTDDVVDKILSLYITGNKRNLGDGVDHSYREISNKFPYLADPDLSFGAKVKSWLAKKFL